MQEDHQPFQVYLRAWNDLVAAAGHDCELTGKLTIMTGGGDKIIPSTYWLINFAYVYRPEQVMLTPSHALILHPMRFRQPPQFIANTNDPALSRGRSEKAIVFD